MTFEEAVMILIEEESQLKLVQEVSANNSVVFVAKTGNLKLAQGDHG